ncbi:MAG TPA: SPW repeat protein [Candidatus Paceibacterota bacterium]|nr:SPW repeat protein [Candidatus Paceibacterota bacterium]
MWQQWTNAILGAWLIAVPFLGFTGTGLAWALVLTGIAVSVLSLWSVGRVPAEDGFRESRDVRLRHQHQ